MAPNDYGIPDVATEGSNVAKPEERSDEAGMPCYMMFRTPTSRMSIQIYGPPNATHELHRFSASAPCDC